MSSSRPSISYLDGNGRLSRMLTALLRDHWQLLIAAGILAEAGERKRDRFYRFRNYLPLLE